VFLIKLVVHITILTDGGNMSYYIYENWQAGPRKAVIHMGSCGFCNDGKGRAGGHNPAHAKWHGPYFTLQLVQNAAAGLPGIMVHKLDRCVR
jgi:hypothetical protein